MSYDNNCKLTLTIQDRKPELSSVTVEQFNIANLRIFYEFLFSGKLSTLRDIQEYLSYAIKILELDNKFTWESVLLYDDEFRILQHTYGFSWAHNHSHLHDAVLNPRWAVKKNNFQLKNDYIFHIKVNERDHLPQEICKPCESFLEKMWILIKDAQEHDSNFNKITCTKRGFYPNLLKFKE